MTANGALRRVAALAILASILAAFSAFQASGDAPKAPPAGNPANAKPIFTSKCIACHKVDGTGGVKLTGNPTPNWKDPKTWADPKRKNVDAYLRDCITNGKAPSGMVAWGKTGQLKPQQIEDLIAYIKTTFKPK
ncbi:MAG TPA: c-type cytochrome [Candidatus Sulfotelmatobacter sp.]|nr:c-type cytochrome [Candidatus Sulfotelmatobacter sp.]